MLVLLISTAPTVQPFLTPRPPQIDCPYCLSTLGPTSFSNWLPLLPHLAPRPSLIDFPYCPSHTWSLVLLKSTAPNAYCHTWPFVLLKSTAPTAYCHTWPLILLKSTAPTAYPHLTPRPSQIDCPYWLSTLDPSSSSNRLPLLPIHTWPLVLLLFSRLKPRIFAQDNGSKTGLCFSLEY